jgi:hypothetical protein
MLTLSSCLSRTFKSSHRVYVGVLISLWLFLFAAQPKEFFLDGLKNLEQRSHKCVELRGEYVEQIHFFYPVACCFLYKAKHLLAPPPFVFSEIVISECPTRAVIYKGGRAVAQAVRRWFPTATDRVRVRAACGVCGGQSGTGAGFLRVLRFPLQIIPPISPSS